MQYQRQRARNPEAEQPKLLFPQQLAFPLLTPPSSPGCHRMRVYALSVKAVNLSPPVLPFNFGLD